MNSILSAPSVKISNGIFVLLLLFFSNILFAVKINAQGSILTNNSSEEAALAGTFCTGTTTLTNCIDSFTDGSGLSDYNNNSNCKWLIQPAGASAIILSFTSFDIEADYDEVCIYDGSSESSPLLDCFSGNSIPSLVSSSVGSMLVVFTSDDIETRPGWSASYYCQVGPYCTGTTTLTSCNDGLDDGSGAGNYLNNSNCQWLIQPTGATFINLTFSSFDTEEDYDEVFIYDGSTDSSPSLGCFSGSSIPSSVSSSTGSMLVVFSSDVSTTGAGWNASYTCQIGSSCNALTTLTNCDGSFHDGSGSGNYANNANCQWLIQPAGATSITLNFTSFVTEKIYDAVYIYDGITDASPLLGCFSGDTIPQPVISSGGSMLVVFTSDVTLPGAGWTAIYNCQTGQYCGTSNLTDCSGSFNDGSGAGNYLNNSNCQWLIQPPGANSITLNFTSFATEEDFDKVFIYDGVDSTTLLGCFSGDSIPPQMTSSGGSMLVVFSSDSSITGAGWSAFYSSCNSGFTVSGFIRTSSNSAVRKVLVAHTGTGAGSDTTATDGAYSFNVSAGDNFTVTPSKNNDITTNNGITTLDIILIQKQILAIQALSTPYKIIAADVNASSGVTTLDIVLIRSIILQSTTAFPNGRLWRFVPSDFVFANPLNPFPFDNFRSYNNITENLTNQNFIGIKLGDVNNSWDPNIAKTGPSGALEFILDDFNAKPGDEIVVPVKVKDFHKITGYQFTLSWNPAVIKLLRVNDKSLKGNFGMQKVNQGFLTTLWSDEMAREVSLSDEEAVFELIFNAIGQNETFSEIKIGSELTFSEAYNENLDLLNIVPTNGIVRVFDDSEITNHQSSIYNLQAQPNPFTTATNIIFSIPQDETVTIAIYDLLGREVMLETANYHSGTHRFAWPNHENDGKKISSGLYHIWMSSANHSISTKAIMLK